MTKAKFQADQKCSLCGETPLPSDTRCKDCLGRCMHCGKPADISTAGFSSPHGVKVRETYGRYCLEHSEINEIGMFKMWEAAFARVTLNTQQKDDKTEEHVRVYNTKLKRYKEGTLFLRALEWGTAIPAKPVMELQ